MARRTPREPTPLPSREEIRRFIRESPGRVGKREVARAFHLGPEHQVALRGVLKSLTHEGAVEPAGARRFRPAGQLPESMAVRITGTDHDGDAIARPLNWQGNGPPPLILMAAEARGRPALAPGERVIAKLKPIGGGKYEGRTIKRLTDAPGRIIGVFQPSTPNGRVVPTDRRVKAEWSIPRGEEGGAVAGEIVLAEPLPHGGYGLKPARIIERLGPMGDARSVSLICIHTHDIPREFPAGAVAEGEAAGPVRLGTRTDLRDTPLITIDGADARDFDDAVYAESDGAGFRLLVAIADVAHYVRPDSALDRSARMRGNSVYFPDRVVPMLPETLSNGWCSLRPDEERGCLFVEMRVDAGGRKISHRFGRGLMKSAARLTYEHIQEAADTGADLNLAPGQIGTLYHAFRALLAARMARGTLDLDLPERKVMLDDDGKVISVEPRLRLDSHRLIEEFMVLANVCAAEELEARRQPCMYRVHAPPSDEKLQNLRDFLRQFDISLAPGNQIHPRDLDHILKMVAGTEHAPMVNEVMLRSQSQAAYAKENIGHFGLGLARYAHFTSPIRRYADLLVHRALIRGLELGLGGLGDDEAQRFEDAAEHITATERRAQLAERDAIDRYLAAFMVEKVGKIFAARISGVTRFGLFVTVADSGASGIVPTSSLPNDFWMHDERTQTLSGRKTRLTFRLAQEVEARLCEASPVTGGLVFHIMQGVPTGARPGRGSRDR
ncbi:MAG: ribonuclease R [Acetobacteraceae bacterium]|nr:ribonuclease R [Acetobacteraceae bacterium]